MPDYTCISCGSGFSLPQTVVDRYPGWTPATCRSCRASTSGTGGTTDANAAPARRRTGGRGRPRGGPKEENLTVAEVLERYTEGPDDGVFTDGSAHPNPGPGGWGAVYVVKGEVIDRAHGHHPDTTNNRMEYTALIAGFDLVPVGTVATVYTDSQLCANTINLWAAGWEARGWKRKKGPVENLDLVQALYAKAKQRPELTLAWIPAHAGARWNEYADSLSTAYRRTVV